MTSLDSLLDRYSLLARQRPALLMLLPGAVTVLVLFPSLQSWWTTLLALFAACGVALALGEFAQGRGKLLEPGLYAAWRGMPSVAMLRHCDDRIDAVTKARYRTYLEANIPSLKLPSSASEGRDPARADELYATACGWLRSKTRDTRKFSLLFRQNIGYGFRRNLLGVRPYGIAIASLSLIAVAMVAVISFSETRPAVDIGVIVNLGALIFWVSAVRPEWVKIAAEAYAIELLAACDVLAVSPRKA